MHTYAQRYGQPLSLLMIDLDHFKRVNETLESLMARADAAFYRAKYAGRSQMVSAETRAD